MGLPQEGRLLAPARGWGSLRGTVEGRTFPHPFWVSRPGWRCLPGSLHQSQLPGRLVSPFCYESSALTLGL